MEKLSKNEDMQKDVAEMHTRIETLKTKAADRLGGIKYNEDMFDFATALEKRRPDARKYRAFHQLIGSTPPPDALDGDFEGEDSIEAFLKLLSEEK